MCTYADFTFYLVGGIRFVLVTGRASQHENFVVGPPLSLAVFSNFELNLWQVLPYSIRKGCIELLFFVVVFVRELGQFSEKNKHGSRPQLTKK